MNAIATQITSSTIVYSIVYSDAYQRRHQSSESLAFVRGTHRGPVNFPHKWPVTRKFFPFDDVIMNDVIMNFFLFLNSPYGIPGSILCIMCAESCPQHWNSSYVIYRISVKTLNFHFMRCRCDRYTCVRYSWVVGTDHCFALLGTMESCWHKC